MGDIGLNDDMKTILGTGKFIRLVRQGGWEYIERTNARGAAVIIAVTEDKKLLLTEQFRPAVGHRVVEPPAGLVGDTEGLENEQLAAAAVRELAEEVGYDALHVEYVGEAPSAASLSSQIVTYFLASGLRKCGPGGGDEIENITIHEVPLDILADWLRQRQRENVYIDPELFMGLYLADLFH